MIKTTEMLLDELKMYASPKTKLSRMIKNGECFQITRGLYETDQNVSPYLLAGSIYGPSYISFEYALSYYGFIPEAVYTITSATYDKRKKKEYKTPYGIFTYRDVPIDAFPLGIKLIKEREYWYRIASPEKAVCDQLYKAAPVHNIAELSSYMLDDMRMDQSLLSQLDKEVIKSFSEVYRSTNIYKLSSLLRRL